MSKSVQTMFSSIAKNYDKTNDFLSFGIHRLWRRQSLRFARTSKEFPVNVLDICCGTGDFLISAKKSLHPASHFVGLDFVWNMLEIAKIKSIRSNNSSLQFIHGDALCLPVANQTIDLCTIGFGIRNVDSTPMALIEFERVLKHGGKLVVLEFGTPHLPIFKTIFKFYSKFIMPYIGMWASGNRSAYEYLPETSASYPCRRDFCKLLVDAKFVDVRYRSFFGGIAYCYVGSKNNLT